MDAWIISIVGIVCVGVFIDIILPSGDMNKYIKGIFAIFTVFVIISPLTKVIGNVKNGALNNIGEDIKVDNAFIENMHRNEVSRLEERIEDILKNNDVSGAKVDIKDKVKDNVIDSITIYHNSPRSNTEVVNILKSNIRYRILEVRVIGTNNR